MSRTDSAATPTAAPRKCFAKTLKRLQKRYEAPVQKAEASPMCFSRKALLNG